MGGSRLWRWNVHLALADLLAPGSVIHAMDRDGSTLRKIPSSHKSVSITTHRGDFTNQMWPFDSLDGILMANSLHYVNDQATFIRACEARMPIDAPLSGRRARHARPVDGCPIPCRRPG